MIQPLWQQMLLPEGDNDKVWELFHENSKLGRCSGDNLSDEQIAEGMKEYHESLDFVGFPAVKLPRAFAPLKLSLAKSITSRSSVQNMTASPVSLETLATMLYYSYGVTRDNKNTNYPRPFRVVPSAGALYPLEIFFHSAYIKGLRAGVYHYNAAKHELRLLRAGDETPAISRTVVQPEVIIGASLIIFITAIFERSIFKYGDRGYRFILLEAGHVAQNINLVSVALGFGSLDIGGYLDREVDCFLELDGVTHSTIYMIAVGKKKK